MAETYEYPLVPIVLGAESRNDAFYNLTVAKIILERAVIKYSDRSSGGLARALAFVKDTLSMVYPTPDELLNEMDQLLANDTLTPRQQARTVAISGELRRFLLARSQGQLANQTPSVSDDPAFFPRKVSSRG